MSIIDLFQLSLQKLMSVAHNSRDLINKVLNPVSQLFHYGFEKVFFLKKYTSNSQMSVILLITRIKVIKADRKPIKNLTMYICIHRIALLLKNSKSFD